MDDCGEGDQPDEGFIDMCTMCIAADNCDEVMMDDDDDDDESENWYCDHDNGIDWYTSSEECEENCDTYCKYIDIDDDEEEMSECLDTCGFNDIDSADGFCDLVLGLSENDCAVGCTNGELEDEEYTSTMADCTVCLTDGDCEDVFGDNPYDDDDDDGGDESENWYCEHDNGIDWYTSSEECEENCDTDCDYGDDDDDGSECLLDCPLSMFSSSTGMCEFVGAGDSSCLDDCSEENAMFFEIMPIFCGTCVADGNCDELFEDDSDDDGDDACDECHDNCGDDECHDDCDADYCDDGPPECFDDCVNGPTYDSTGTEICEFIGGDISCTEDCIGEDAIPEEFIGICAACIAAGNCDEIFDDGDGDDGDSDDDGE